MHIDTVFTQVKRNVWVMLGDFSKKTMKHEDTDSVQRVLEGSKKDEKLSIIQFRRKDIDNPSILITLKTCWSISVRMIWAAGKK